MENVSNKKKTIFLIVVGILLVGSILMGVSYAAWVATLSQTGRNVVNTDCFGITFTDKDEIDLQNAFPIRESDAANLKPYEFTIANRCDTSEDYIINLETVAPTNISSEFVRIKIDDEQSTKLSQKTVNDNKVISNAIEARTIIVGNLVGKESKTYRLKMWIDESATVSDVENKSLAAKVTIAGTLNKNSKIITLNLNGGTLDINRILGTIGNKIGTLPTPIKEEYNFAGWYSDSELTQEVTTETIVTEELTNLYAKWEETIYSDVSGASSPELYQGLVPVKYVNNEIVIANTSEEWYNYANHEWANAVIPTSAARTKTAGQTLSESEIQQMYVWIPRYRYQLWNAENGSSNEQMINIEFESRTTPKSTGSTNGTWLTHPAFTFGETELNGIWVGKFEPSGSTTDINIKPNVSSLRDIIVGDAFNASRNIELTYASNFNLNQNEIDTHMMKNMEWGATVYLSHSKYGRLNSDGTCVSGGCEIWINPNSNYTTGCAGDSVSASEISTCNQWNTANGVHASTTDNQYGVYDMSGGAHENVMGNVAQNTTTYTYTAGSSGLSTMPEAKYIDTYTNSTKSDTAHANGKLGDATKETLKTFGSSSGGGWYSDNAFFPSGSFVWFIRGGRMGNGTRAGTFFFDFSKGSSSSNGSFRVVLSAQ